MTRTILTTATLVAALALGACNTVAGAGKDTTSAGKAITKAAEPGK